MFQPDPLTTTTAATSSSSTSSAVSSAPNQSSGQHPPEMLDQRVMLEKVEQRLKAFEERSAAVGGLSPTEEDEVRRLKLLRQKCYQQINQSEQPSRVFLQQHISKLVHDVDPQSQLDDDVQTVLMQVADDFLEEVLRKSCALARHRNSTVLEVKDVSLALQRNWNITVPGYTQDLLSIRLKKAEAERQGNFDAHRQRLQVLRKSSKKS